MRFVMLLVVVVIALVAGVVGLQLSGNGDLLPPQVSDLIAAVLPPADAPHAHAAAMPPLPALPHPPVPAAIQAAAPATPPAPPPASPAAVASAPAPASASPAVPAFVARARATLNTVPLADTLPVGMRAVTLSADAVASGLPPRIMPGDHVDVLFVDAAAHGRKKVDSEVLSDRPVVAVTDQSVPAITLVVTAAQAKQLLLAEKTGTLAVALRSTVDERIEVAEAAHKETAPAEKPGTVRVVRGLSDHQGYFTEGGAHYVRVQ